MKDQERKVSIESEVPIRTLVYIPIIHTETDMGTLSDSIQRSTLEKFGKEGLKRKTEIIEELWTSIEKKIHGLGLEFEKVRIYQDGLPLCGCEAEIVAELAHAGSRNHRVLLPLLKRGAKVMGTESVELLMEEYELAKQIMAGRGAGRKTRSESSRNEKLDTILKRRDQFISHRINTSLCAGETGIVFLGLLHSLGDKLDPDIHVIYPLNPGMIEEAGYEK